MENTSDFGDPRTVVKWHRAGFRIYWKWLSRVKRMGARKPVSHQVRALIFRMAAENPTWGAPRIHGELLREIVRQQWNFSPPETVSEVQEYQVELSDVTVLELSITPDISGGTARAALKSLRLS